MSSPLADALLAELDDDALDALAERLAPRLAGRLGSGPSPAWLTSREAAEHLACSRKRIYDLTERRALAPRRDGRRLLFRREDLDAYLERAT